MKTFNKILIVCQGLFQVIVLGQDGLGDIH